MTPRKSRRRRHVPQRTCVGCREVLQKRSLTRVVRGPEGVSIDPTGKAPGRGAYVHEKRSCWERALKGSLSRALRTGLTNEELEKLSAYMNGNFDE
ncbi:MAG: YlxR family protein [Anaerolineales bacterium]|nr:YlxR family protein [Anaerolineales bacterium]